MGSYGLKSFTLTIPGNLAKLVKIFPESLYVNTHRSETNGIAERAVRRVNEGTSAVLLQSGLDENWWANSMECYTHLRNIQDLLSDGKTPHKRRFGMPFNGPVTPFGAVVECYSIFAKKTVKNPSVWKESLEELKPMFCVKPAVSASYCMFPASVMLLTASPRLGVCGPTTCANWSTEVKGGVVQGWGPKA